MFPFLFQFSEENAEKFFKMVHFANCQSANLISKVCQQFLRLVCHVVLIVNSDLISSYYLRFFKEIFYFHQSLVLILIPGNMPYFYVLVLTLNSSWALASSYSDNSFAKRVSTLYCFSEVSGYYLEISNTTIIISKYS